MTASAVRMSACETTSTWLRPQHTRQGGMCPPRLQVAVVVYSAVVVAYPTHKRARVRTRAAEFRAGEVEARILRSPDGAVGCLVRRTFPTQQPKRKPCPRPDPAAVVRGCEPSRTPRIGSARASAASGPSLRSPRLSHARRTPLSTSAPVLGGIVTLNSSRAALQMPRQREPSWRDKLNDASIIRWEQDSDRGMPHTLTPFPSWTV